MTQQILEGTWEEIATHAQELAGHRLRVVVLSDKKSRKPNEGMLQA